MADSNGNSGVDRGSLTAHVKTYDGVMALMKWSSIVIAVVIVPLVIWLIAT